MGSASGELASETDDVNQKFIMTNKNKEALKVYVTATYNNVINSRKIKNDNCYYWNYVDIGSNSNYGCLDFRFGS
mgnify:CR=1 FL=1